MTLNDPGLENRRLRFEPLYEAHRDVLNTPETIAAIWKWMPPLTDGTNFDNYFDFMLAAQAHGAVAAFVLFDREKGTWEGITGFDTISRQHRRVRIAFAWHPPATFEPEIFQLTQLSMIKRAMDWRAKRIEWQVYSKNTFFLEHLEALGPTREAVLRQEIRMADGSWADKIVFSMINQEPEQAIRRLAPEMLVSEDAARPLR